MSGNTSMGHERERRKSNKEKLLWAQKLESLPNPKHTYTRSFYTLWLILLKFVTVTMVRVSVLNDALKSMYNAEKRGKRQVMIRPSSKVIIKFLLVMQKHGYIGEFEYVDDHRAGKIVVELNGRLNKCGVISPRFDVGVKEIEGWTARLLPSRQFGYIVLTTSAGIMDHEEARRKNVGGKVLDPTQISDLDVLLMVELNSGVDEDLVKDPEDLRKMFTWLSSVFCRYDHSCFTKAQPWLLCGSITIASTSRNSSAINLYDGKGLFRWPKMG
ncbi:40S ribosomal protein S15a-1 isoform A [Glycine soja]|uniref:40S ribosomal protein S15a-1 isoform A n=1 Tax=Glycine soja TaxID=3848 RepID=A0A445GRJ7_GLYSO|nr:40S ribosomal protein S15a-1 isoform A [Glycine soja]